MEVPGLGHSLERLVDEVSVGAATDPRDRGVGGGCRFLSFASASPRLGGAGGSAVSGSASIGERPTRPAPRARRQRSTGTPECHLRHSKKTAPRGLDMRASCSAGRTRLRYPALLPTDGASPAVGLPRTATRRRQLQTGYVRPDLAAGTVRGHTSPRRIAFSFGDCLDGGKKHTGPGVGPGLRGYSPKPGNRAITGPWAGFVERLGFWTPLLPRPTGALKRVHAPGQGPGSGDGP